MKKQLHVPCCTLQLESGKSVLELIGDLTYEMREAAEYGITDVHYDLITNDYGPALSLSGYRFETDDEYHKRIAGEARQLTNPTLRKELYESLKKEFES